MNPLPNRAPFTIPLQAYWSPKGSKAILSQLDQNRLGKGFLVGALRWSFFKTHPKQHSIVNLALSIPTPYPQTRETQIRNNSAVSSVVM